MFHVSQLKKFRGTLPIVAHIPSWFHGKDAENTEVKPEAIVDKRMVKHHNKAQMQYLVKWEGFPAHEASWELAEQFEERFPDFLVT